MASQIENSIQNLEIKDQDQDQEQQQQSIHEAFKGKKLPKDEEGFVQAFTVGQLEEAQKFFEEYGLVVFKDVLNESEIEQSVNSIWENVMSANPLIKRGDPESWNNIATGAVGIMGRDIAHTRSSWEVRQNPKVYECFKGILKTEDLLVSMDRYGMMRPTKDIKLKDGTVVDHPEWKTRDSWFHWDLNPWTYETTPKKTDEEELYDAKHNGRFVWEDVIAAADLLICENNGRSKSHFGDVDKVQGLIAFEDSGEENGGFQCVPGFHSFLSKWAQKVTPYSQRREHVNCPKVDEDIYPNVAKVTIRKGSLIIWSGSLPHCNYPNHSNKFRMVQYVKMFPRTVLPLHMSGYMKARANYIKSRMPNDFVLNEIGKKVFGLTFDYLNQSS